ncbi:cupin domain-containing protein [Paenibacillus sp. S150]|uniref:cupin domain-containing protein n=1 Tax=Paenibacillus sp. S150 TaxID=2749826 RepID=UPI001C562574|nr:cupin domain-containing protein [Paenibacillus sp. S150]MBW4083012.1 cupin domain-containing protein [Paenibacillus sp. S150]
MTDVVLQSPDVKLAADSNQVLNYQANSYNYITQLFGAQLPAIRNGFFNAHLSKGFIIQPHWHTNVTEMVFVISGELITSVFDPFTQKLVTYQLKPGQVSIFPKGWFHWIVAVSDQVHFLTIFDQPTPDIVYGSDFLRTVPKEVIQRAYCISEEDYAKAVAPLKESVIIGPPPGCNLAGSNAGPGNKGAFAESAAPNSRVAPRSGAAARQQPGAYPPYPAGLR